MVLRGCQEQENGIDLEWHSIEHGIGLAGAHLRLAKLLCGSREVKNVVHDLER